MCSAPWCSFPSIFPLFSFLSLLSLPPFLLFLPLILLRKGDMVSFHHPCIRKLVILFLSPEYWDKKHESSFLPMLDVPFPSFNYFILLCVWVFPQHVCLCMMYAHRSQKKLSDPMELEFQMVVNNNVDAGDQTWVLWKSSECSYEPSGPTLCFLS